MRSLTIIALLIAGAAHAEDRSPHQIEGGELRRVSIEPYTIGPATLRAPVRIGPGVVAVHNGEGVVVSCESSSVEVLRLREQLRLRAAELLVVRGQLAAAQRRSRTP